jgi:hypothetical protein
VTRSSGELSGRVMAAFIPVPFCSSGEFLHWVERLKEQEGAVAEGPFSVTAGAGSKARHDGALLGGGLTRQAGTGN